MKNKTGSHISGDHQWHNKKNHLKIKDQGDYYDLNEVENKIIVLLAVARLRNPSEEEIKRNKAMRCKERW